MREKSDMNPPDAGVIRSFRRSVHNAIKRGDVAMMTPLPVLRYLIGMIDALTEGPLTPEQAQEAFDAQADASPLPEERINAIVSRVVTMDELTTANRRLREDVTDLLAALERLIEAAPAFRAAPIGSPWSDARRQQDLHQEAEDIALVVIAKAKGNP